MTSYLLSLFFRSIALSAIAWCVMWLLRRRSAALQHSVLVLFLIGIAALPLAGLSLPSHVIDPGITPIELKPLKLAPDGIGGAAASSSAPAAQSSIELVPLIWAAGCLVLTLRLAASLVQMRRALSRSRPVDLGRDTAVVESAEVRMPMTLWLGRHYIVLPVAWQSWDAARLVRVLDHEEAHVRRGDWFAQIFALAVDAAFWLNPFVPPFLRKLRHLAERAADDRVLELGCEPSQYASDLLDLTRESSATPPAFAIPMAAKPDVARRIEMILDKKTHRRRTSMFSLAVTALMVSSLAIPLASWALGSKSIPKVEEPAQIEQIFEIKASVYSAPQDDIYSVSHRIAVKEGTPCLACHRSNPGQAVKTPSVTAMAVSPEYAERSIKAALNGGGALLTQPTLVTRDGQKAEITVSPTQENRREMTLALTPSTNDGIVLLAVRLTQKLNGKTVSDHSGTAAWKAGQQIMVVDKDKRRLIILEVKIQKD